jgi:hypothetical protein
LLRSMALRIASYSVRNCRSRNINGLGCDLVMTDLPMTYIEAGTDCMRLLFSSLFPSHLFSSRSSPHSISTPSQRQCPNEHYPCTCLLPYPFEPCGRESRQCMQQGRRTSHVCLADSSTLTRIFFAGPIQPAYRPLPLRPMSWLPLSSCR